VIPLINRAVTKPLDESSASFFDAEQSISRFADGLDIMVRVQHCGSPSGQPAQSEGNVFALSRLEAPERLVQHRDPRLQHDPQRQLGQAQFSPGQLTDTAIEPSGHPQPLGRGPPGSVAIRHS
jgi:hypothetical protein